MKSALINPDSKLSLSPRLSFPHLTRLLRSGIVLFLFFCPLMVTASETLKQHVITLEPDSSHVLRSKALLLKDPQDFAQHSAPVPRPDQLIAYDPSQPAESLWYRFDIHNATQDQRWFLNITNTLVESVQLYSRSGDHYRVSRNGFELRYPFDITFAVPVTLEPNHITSLWLNINSPVLASHPLLTLMPEQKYHRHHFNYTAMVLVALGAMLALVIYNAFLYFPTRDSSFIWYACYQLLCTFAWAVQFKVMLYCFDIGLDPATLYLPFFIGGAASLMFAITFLRLPHGNWFTLSLQGLAIAMVIAGVGGLMLPLEQYYRTLVVTVFLWLPLMLALGIWRYQSGYRPARIYVIGFIIMGAVLTFIVTGNLLGSNLIDNQMLWALWAQLIDAVALALALADRINFLRKSRQHADKRATTDRLTGLPNRTAFERDVRSWEAWYAQGTIQEFYLTFIDVDGLKEVNDRNGHNEGDRLLVLISQWLAKKVNPKNVYRIGGDEFLVLSGKQIQWDLSSLHLLLDREGFPRSDLSIGSSSYSESGNRSTLLKLADERMYAIKHG